MSATSHSDGADPGPLVSVVTPVYNTAAYLAECIESVLDQDYPHFEYIILDNCSDDGSYEIALDYARKDGRIAVFQNEKLLPQRKNYNAALRLIGKQSTFTKLVQADDRLYPHCLGSMVRVALASESVRVVCALQMEGRRVLGSGLSPDRELFDGADPCREYLLRGNSVFGTPTSMLFRSDDVRARDRFYDEDSYTEDVDVCFELLEGQQFGFVHQVLGYLRVHDGSITSDLLQWQPWPLHHLMILERYGTRFLSASEFQRRRRALRYRYAHVLGRGVLKRYGAAFMDYQREGFRQMGAQLGTRWVVKSVLIAISDYLFNPKLNIEARLLDEPS